MDRFGRFELEKELGRGASATVYLARCTDSNTKLSLKIFHPKIFQDSRLTQRIRREFKVLAALKHPNIVPVHSLFDSVDPPALAMDYIDGENLEIFQSRLPYTLPEVALLITLEILKALEYAHSQDLIHRDLKPENVILSRDGKVFVTDFGLAKFQDASTLITQPNHVLGSADYMSPEQTTGNLLTPLSDLFSISAVLYFLTTGTRPFSRSNAVATLSAIRYESAEAPEKRNPKISSALSRIIQKGLAKEPQDRFQSAREFREVILEYLENLGLTEEIFSLPLWMKDPTSTTLDALRVSSEKIIKLAEGAANAKDWSHLLEHVAHLSIKAPESSQIPRLVNTMRQSKQHRWKLAACASLAILLVAFVAVRYRNTQPAHKSAVNTSQMAQRDLTSEIRFHVQRGVQVFWDGKHVDPSIPLKEKFSGNHELILKHKDFEPIRRTISVKAGEPVTINAR